MSSRAKPTRLLLIPDTRFPSEATFDGTLLVDKGVSKRWLTPESSECTTKTGANGTGVGL